MRFSSTNCLAIRATGPIVFKRRRKCSTQLSKRWSHYYQRLLRIHPRLQHLHGQFEASWVCVVLERTNEALAVCGGWTYAFQIHCENLGFVDRGQLLPLCHIMTNSSLSRSHWKGLVIRSPSCGSCPQMLLRERCLRARITRILGKPWAASVGLAQSTCLAGFHFLLVSRGNKLQRAWAKFLQPWRRGCMKLRHSSHCHLKGTGCLAMF